MRRLRLAKTRLPALFFVLAAFWQPTAAQVSLPAFEMWVECIARGPYPGRADAQLSYRYDGAFAIMAEDSRYYGDVGTAYIQLMPMAIEPGEHRKFTQVSVGAFKVVVWKVVFMNKLHVLTIWDDPAIADCPWDAAPTPVPDLSNQT